MKKILKPLNIELLIPTKEQLKMVGQVTSLDIMDGPGGGFHENGLFSTTIFGRVGDPKRDMLFGYIDLRFKVLHPIVYRTLRSMRALFEDVMAGKEYARFDPIKKTLVKANEFDGRTGYSFFMEVLEQLEFEKGKSDIRNVQISLLEKYHGRLGFDKLLVLPAGLRDAETDGLGRVTVGEINDHYQRCLMISRNFPEVINPGDDITVYDRARYALQMAVNKIYEHLESLIFGKGGIIQAKWASRRIFNGTRNVISSLDVTAVDLDQPNRPGFNSAVVGIFQAAVASMPITIYQLKTNLLDQVFNTTSNTIELIDKETLKLVRVDVSNETMDRWSTPEGLEKVIGELEVIEKRHRPVEIEDHYLALVYVDDKNNFKMFRDIEDFPDHLDKKFIRPLTYVEMFYITGLDRWEEIPAFITRYPVENINSSSAVMQYVKTTIPAKLCYGLDENWEPTDYIIAKEYPIFPEGKLPQYQDSISIPVSRLAAKGADNIVPPHRNMRMFTLLIAGNSR